MSMRPEKRMEKRRSNSKIVSKDKGEGGKIMDVTLGWANVDMTSKDTM